MSTTAHHSEVHLNPFFCSNPLLKVMGDVGGLCDFSVTLVPIGLEFRTALGLGLGRRGQDFGLELDNSSRMQISSDS